MSGHQPSAGEQAIRSALEAGGWVATEAAPVIAMPIPGRLIRELPAGWAATAHVSPLRLGERNPLRVRVALTYPKAERVMAALDGGQCNLQVGVVPSFSSHAGEGVLDLRAPDSSVADFLTYVDDVALPWCLRNSSVSGWAVWLRHDGYDEDNPDPDDVRFYVAMLLAHGRDADARRVLMHRRTTNPSTFDLWDEEFEEQVEAFIAQGTRVPDVWPAPSTKEASGWQPPAFTDNVADEFAADLTAELRKRPRLERWKHTGELLAQTVRATSGAAKGPGGVSVDQARWRSVELYDGIDVVLERAYTGAGRPVARRVDLDARLVPNQGVLDVELDGRSVGSIARDALPRDVVVDAPSHAFARLTKKDAAPRFLLQILFRSTLY